MIITTVDTILFIGGMITFPATFILQKCFWDNSKICRDLTKKHNLQEWDIADIVNKIVSAFQAVLCAVSGLIVCLNCSHDVMYASHPLTLIYAYFGIPYFIYDTFSMFYVDFLRFKNTNQNIVVQFIHFALTSPVIIIHHVILAPLGFSLIAFGRDGVHNGDYFAGIVYLMEASTPFVSIRSILSKLNMKSTLLYAVNGMMMLVSFPIFRIFTIFYAVGVYSAQNNVGYFESLWILPLGWKLSLVAAVAPQIYWCFLMWKGFFKILMESKKGEVAKENGYEKHPNGYGNIPIESSNNSAKKIS